MNKKRSFVAELNGQEYPFDLFDDGHGLNVGSMQKEAAQKAVYASGLKRKDRNLAETVVVRVWELSIESGKIVKSNPGSHRIDLAPSKMTETEFMIERQEIVADIPCQFHGFLFDQSWERGHSAGYEEIIGILQDMADGIVPAITAYVQLSH